MPQGSDYFSVFLSCCGPFSSIYSRVAMQYGLGCKSEELRVPGDRGEGAREQVLAGVQPLERGQRAEGGQRAGERVHRQAEVREVLQGAERRYLNSTERAFVTKSSTSRRVPVVLYSTSIQTRPRPMCVAGASGAVPESSFSSRCCSSSCLERRRDATARPELPGRLLPLDK